MIRYLVRADDFGLSEGASLGILKAYNEGIVTSTSMIVNLDYSKQAAELLDDSKICVGLHVNIVLGKPVSAKVDHLVDLDTGNFLSSKYYRNLDENIDPLAEYENDLVVEINAQLDKFIELLDRKPDYIDTHAIRSKTLTSVVSKIAKENDLKFIADEDLSNNLTKIPTRTVSIYDLYKSSVEPEEIMEQIKDGFTGNDTFITVIHPAYLDIEILRRSTLTLDRLSDLQFATCKETRDIIAKNGIELISHIDL